MKVDPGMLATRNGCSVSSFMHEEVTASSISEFESRGTRGHFSQAGRPKDPLPQKEIKTLGLLNSGRDSNSNPEVRRSIGDTKRCILGAP